MNRYYQDLGIDSSASSTDIKKAYKALVKKYHPDTCKNLDKKNAAVAFQRVKKAYSVLGNYDKKMYYDIALKKQNRQQGSINYGYRKSSFTQPSFDDNVSNFGAMIAAQIKALYNGFVVALSFIGGLVQNCIPGSIGEYSARFIIFFGLLLLRALELLLCTCTLALLTALALYRKVHLRYYWKYLQHWRKNS